MFALLMFVLTRCFYLRVIARCHNFAKVRNYESRDIIITDFRVIITPRNYAKLRVITRKYNHLRKNVDLRVSKKIHLRDHPTVSSPWKGDLEYIV